MKELYIFRHAKTLPAEGYQRDHERMLAQQGKEDCAKVGEYLKEKGWLPELVLCSDAARTVETLDLTEKSAGSTFNREITDRLYLASAGDIFRIVNECPPSLQSIMVLGHNPGLHQFCFHLAPRDALIGADIAFSFPTGTLVKLSLDVDSWQDVSPETKASLAGYLIPKEI